MHWRDRWEYESKLEYQAYLQRPQAELLALVRADRMGNYYQLWRAIGIKGTLSEAADALLDYLREHPGERLMHNRYHCAAALFKLVDLPPEVTDDLRPRVQWEHHGEAARQSALDELEALIGQRLADPDASREG